MACWPTGARPNRSTSPLIFRGQSLPAHWVRVGSDAVHVVLYLKAKIHDRAEDGGRDDDICDAIAVGVHFSPYFMRASD